MFRAYLGFGEGLKDAKEDWQNSHERDGRGLQGIKLYVVVIGIPRCTVLGL